ncbi:hypothetical protein Btru_040071 [Bulinus truncatus]|nr:hypothetical protein Btru_040071 [Bulinus truncatus]
MVKKDATELLVTMDSLGLQEPSPVIDSSWSLIDPTTVSADNLYTIKYRSLSRANYSNNFVWINGKKIKENYSLEPVLTDSLSAYIKVNRQRPEKISKERCNVTRCPTQGGQINGQIKFCTTGVSYPTVSPSIGCRPAKGLFKCVTCAIKSWEQYHQLSFEYRDDCGLNGLYPCTIRSSDQNCTYLEETPETSTGNWSTSPGPRISEELDYMPTVIATLSLSAIILIVGGISVAYCYKQQMLIFRRDETTTTSYWTSNTIRVSQYSKSQYNKSQYSKSQHYKSQHIKSQYCQSQHCKSTVRVDTVRVSTVRVNTVGVSSKKSDRCYVPLKNFNFFPKESILRKPRWPPVMNEVRALSTFSSFTMNGITWQQEQSPKCQ